VVPAEESVDVRIGRRLFGLVCDGAHHCISSDITVCTAVLQNADESIVGRVRRTEISIVWHCRDLNRLTIPPDVRRVPGTVLEMVRIKSSTEVHTGTGEDHVDRVRIVPEYATVEAILDQLYHLAGLYDLSRLWRARPASGPESVVRHRVLNELLLTADDLVVERVDVPV